MTEVPSIILEPIDHLKISQKHALVNLFIGELCDLHTRCCGVRQCEQQLALPRGTHRHLQYGFHSANGGEDIPDRTRYLRYCDKLRHAKVEIKLLVVHTLPVFHKRKVSVSFLCEMRMALLSLQASRPVLLLLDFDLFRAPWLCFLDNSDDSNLGLAGMIAASVQYMRRTSSG
jgi:hypothetical protein